LSVRVLACLHLFLCYYLLSITMGDGGAGGGAIVTTLISKLDSSSPIYLHASDSSNLTITSIKLKGVENYTIWANSMTLVL
jgi:hypothetical protein